MRTREQDSERQIERGIRPKKKKEKKKKSEEQGGTERKIEEQRRDGREQKE